METKKAAHGQAREAQAARQHYHSPCLTECGSVGDLTQAGATTSIEISDDPSYNLTYVSSPM